MRYICNTEEQVLNLYDELADAPVFAYDIEYLTEKNQFLGIGIATEENSYYVPFQHDTKLKQLEPSFFFNVMFCIFSDSTTIKAIHGGMVFEIGLLQKYGVDVVNYFDTMIAHWLVDENTKQGLKELMLIEYGKVRSKFKALPKDYPVKITAEYCMQDAENTLQLYHNLRPRLEAEKVDKWFYNVEMPLIKILLDMSKYGFPVDLKWLTEGVSKEIQTKIIAAKSSIFKVAGQLFNLEANKQMAEFLFDKLKLPATKVTEKTGSRSVNEEALKAIESKHKVVSDVLEYRGLQKLQSTYVEGILNAVKDDERIHAELVQQGTRTGRFSCRNINMQNIPQKGELGKKIRQTFVAEKGYALLKADQSQFELRIMAHKSEDQTLVNAYKNNLDLHKQTASKLFNKTEELVTKDERYIGKTGNFALQYGMGKHTWCNYLNNEGIAVEREVSDSWWNVWWANFPGVKAYHDKILKQLSIDEFVYTFSPRKRRFPQFKYYASQASTNKDMYFRVLQMWREAVNASIQGFVGNWMRLSMLEFVAKLPEELKDKCFMIMQVHDELVFHCREEVVDIAKPYINKCMVQPYGLKLKVPLEVEIQQLKRWGGDE